MRFLMLSMFVTTSCVAQTTRPADMPATAPVVSVNDAATQAVLDTDDVSTNAILDAMHKAGVEMVSLRANLSLQEKDEVAGDDNLRTGSVLLQRRGEGNTRIRVNFDKLDVNGKQRYKERIEYVLDGDWVTDRVYGRGSNDPGGRRETHRQIRKAGDKTDLLKLGEGPFPLPIGQPRESVRAEFQVTRLPDDPKQPGLIGLELRPKPTNRLSQRFESITVWVDPATGMPHVIETLDPNQSQRRVTTLTDVKINQDVSDADFTLEKIDDKVWTITNVPMD